MTIAEEFNHNFDNGDFELFDKMGNRIYSENKHNFWKKSTFNRKKEIIYSEDSTDFWAKWEYDKNGKRTYYEDSEGLIINYWKHFSAPGGKLWQEMKY